MHSNHFQMDDQWYDKCLLAPGVWSVSIPFIPLTPHEYIKSCLVTFVKRNIEYAAFFAGDILHVILVGPHQGHVYRGDIYYVLDFQLLENNPFRDHTRNAQHLHYARSTPGWLTGAPGLMWTMRNFSCIAMTADFQALDPIDEWLAPDDRRGGALVPLRVLPKNRVTRSFYGVIQQPWVGGIVYLGGVMSYFYCVEKSTLFDFWILPKRDSWYVLNGGVLTRDNHNRLSYSLATLGVPPAETFAFIECTASLSKAALYSRFFWNVYPFAAQLPNRSCEEILAVMFFHGHLHTVHSSVTLTVRVLRKNYRRLKCKFFRVAKRAADPQAPPLKCFQCNVSRGLYPSCQHRECKAVICNMCVRNRYKRSFHDRCVCGMLPTQLWWQHIKPFEKDYFRVIQVGEDQPASLAYQCMHLIKRVPELAETAERLLPGLLLERMSEESDQIDYAMETEG